jgi:hypothetical protein
MTSPASSARLQIAVVRLVLLAPLICAISGMRRMASSQPTASTWALQRALDSCGEASTRKLAGAGRLHVSAERPTSPREIEGFFARLPANRPKPLLYAMASAQHAR